MKNFTILLLTIIFTACSANKKIIESEKQIQEPVIDKVEMKVEEKVIKVTAKKDASGHLSGIANKQSFADPSFKPWFDSKYNTYITDKETISKLTEALKGYTIKGFMGTWCGDSKRGVPRFYKILDQTGFDQNNFELITVGRNKKTPDNLQEGFNLIRVPTFIFFKNGKEVGRYVERPRETLEKDILKIVTNQPYKHSYDKS
ncbi:thioredoxin family protein [uncultured Polaribacter sp.]|uniref:thioredoxin family protein n=1 Tax=uncultured Polaribacter sp. TaxID=174711 RepID=UPI00261B76FD|nr:thioredoxin family protein [uncultured Polaribacter sp.]